VLLAEVKRFAATLLPEMHSVDPATHIEFDPLSATPGFDSHQGSEVAELGKQWSRTRDVGKVSFGSEAALFHSAGVPTIICGPGHIAQAHQPNEWVALEQLELCETFMRRLADDLCVA
jgi:acetylornithine deacetylase